MGRDYNEDNKITLELDSFDFEKAKIALVEKFFELNPDTTFAEAAKALNMSERTFYRYLKNNNLTQKFKKNKMIKDAINYLQKQGFDVIKKDQNGE